MTLSIRPIQIEDNPILARIIRNVFEEFDAPRKGTVYEDSTTDKLYNYFHTEGAIGLVAEHNQKVVGCCGIYPTEGLDHQTAEVVKFYLQKEARGRGLGKILLEKSIENAKELGYKNLYIESLEQFNSAVSLYRKYGFEPLQKRLGNSGHIGCPLWFLKKL
ncbi:MAG: GNAT family N-acetyltransferase [Vicingaceae bacterium]